MLRRIAILFLFQILIIQISALNAQSLQQTIKGKVIDKESKVPLVVVSELVLNSSQAIGVGCDTSVNTTETPGI